MKVAAIKNQPIVDSKPVAAEQSKTDFSARLKAKTTQRTSAIEQRVETAITQITTDHKKVERAMKRAMRGAEMSQPELLALQSLLYRYQQEVDLASKVVDKTTNGFKQIMNTQV